MHDIKSREKFRDPRIPPLHKATGNMIQIKGSVAHLR